MTRQADQHPLRYFQARSRAVWLGGIVTLLLIGFALILADIQRDSLWLDEAWTANAVHDAVRPPDGLRDTLRWLRNSITQVFEQVRADVHPPLYFFLMDGWVLLTGESELTLRLPSALADLLALAAVMALGRHWFSRRAGLFALVLLGTSGFFLYYAREARMYALLLALWLLALWLYSLWWQRGGRLRAILLAVLLVLALYTHYVAVFLVAALLLHALLTRRWRFLLIAGGTALLYAPWLPFALRQWQAHPGGAAALLLSSGLETIAALWLLLTSGYWLNFTLPFVLALPALSAHWRDIRWRSGVGLLLLAGLLPAWALLLLNAQGLAVFQIRYVIPLLALWLLLVAWALDQIRLPRFGGAIQIVLLLWLAFTQLSMMDDLWQPKPRWREAVAQAAQTRTSLEPAVVHINPNSPAAWYDRRFSLQQGISLDIGWKSFTADEVAALLGVLEDAPAVWAVLPMQDPSSWDAVGKLAASRAPAYQDSVQGMIFYRFDSAASAQLAFTFGGMVLNWQYEHWQVQSGQEWCLSTGLPDQAENRMLLALTRGYHEVLYQAEIPAAPQACLLLPENLPPDTLHLRLYVLNEHGARLPLTENGLYWGDFAVLGTVQPLP